MRRVAILLLLGLAVASAQTRLSTITVVALGDGLPAGMGDFGLHERYQRHSFPALVARQIGAIFPQPLLEAPGLGHIPGYPKAPVAAPGPLGTTVRTPFPGSLFVFNLSVPGMKTTQAMHVRVEPPLVHSGDMLQTAVNFIVGFPSLLLGDDKPLYTQVEAAAALNPTLVLLCYGYSDVLDAAAWGDPALLPDPAAVRAEYARILDAVRARFAETMIVNVPDPLDTAYATTIPAAARRLNLTAERIQSWWRLDAGDLITPAALLAMGEQVDDGRPGQALPDRSIIRASAAATIRERVAAMNREIASMGQQARSEVVDLHALFRRVRSNGLAAGSHLLTAEYLGGFYTLNGLFPGTTGNAAIANEVLTAINRVYGRQYPLIDLTTVAPEDPALRFRPSVVQEVAQ